MTAQDFLEICVVIGMGLFVLSVPIGFIRLWRGPSLADRVIALDMMTAAIIGFCALFAVQAANAAFLDIAIALALVSFIAVVALARYAERLARRSDRDD